MPNAFGGHADDGSSYSDVEDKIVLDPRTPSDYALHAIFIRFAASAETHMDEFLRFPVVCICHTVARAHVADGVDTGS